MLGPKCRGKERERSGHSWENVVGNLDLCQFKWSPSPPAALLTRWTWSRSRKAVPARRAVDHAHEKTTWTRSNHIHSEGNTARQKEGIHVIGVQPSINPLLNVIWSERHALSPGPRNIACMHYRQVHEILLACTIARSTKYCLHGAASS